MATILKRVRQLNRSMSFFATLTYLEEALGALWDRSRSNIQLLYAGKGGEGEAGSSTRVLWG